MLKSNHRRAVMLTRAFLQMVQLYILPVVFLIPHQAFLPAQAANCMRCRAMHGFPESQNLILVFLQCPIAWKESQKDRRMGNLFCYFGYATEPKPEFFVTDSAGTFRTWIANGFGPDWNPVWKR
jgi:hypothetical protein